MEGGILWLENDQDDERGDVTANQMVEFPGGGEYIHWGWDWPVVKIGVCC